MLSGGSLGHPGTSLGVPSDTDPHEYFVVGVFVGIRYRVAVKKDSTVVGIYGIFSVCLLPFRLL